MCSKEGEKAGGGGVNMHGAAMASKRWQASLHSVLIRPGDQSHRGFPVAMRRSMHIIAAFEHASIGRREKSL